LSAPTRLPDAASIWKIQTSNILSVISFTLKNMPGLAAWQKLLLSGFEVFCVLVFTLEYSSRIGVAEHKLKFIFVFFGLVDLLAILPFYLSFGVDLRTLRAFRLLRMFKILRLPKYARAIRRIRLALALIKEEIILFLSLSGVLLWVSTTSSTPRSQRLLPRCCTVCGGL